MLQNVRWLLQILVLQQQTCDLQLHFFAAATVELWQRRGPTLDSSDCAQRGMRLQTGAIIRELDARGWRALSPQAMAEGKEEKVRHSHLRQRVEGADTR